MEKNNWYIVRTKSNKEKNVAERLINESQKGDLMGKISEVIVPTEYIIYNRNNKKVKREKILFPGYVFICTSAVAEIKTFIQMMSDTLGFLKDRSGNITPVSQREIERVYKLMEETSERDLDINIKEGDEVLVIDGPFSKMKGRVFDVTPNKVKINISIFGRNTPVELEHKDIEKQF